MRDLSAFVEWDVNTWSRAFRFWHKIGKELGIYQKSGLELGSRNGGSACFFATQFKTKIYCSDYGGPEEIAKLLHKEYQVDSLMTYGDIDAKQIPFEDNTFDFVFFKSILGTIGQNDDIQTQQDVLNEIYRVLKPGGVLFFAENMKASFLHQIARKLFVSWASYWRYPTYIEMNNFLKSYQKVQIKTTGFFALFVPNTTIKKVLSKFDKIIDPILPVNWKYVAYGYAIK